MAHGLRSWPWKLFPNACIDLWIVSLKLKFEFQSFSCKMEKCMLILLLVAAVAGMAGSCEKLWWTQQVLCCQNGSAVRIRNGIWVWTEERPIICGPIRWQAVTKNVSVATTTEVVFGTLACLACHLYYMFAYIFYRIVVRPRWWYTNTSLETEAETKRAWICKELVQFQFFLW